MSQGIERLYFTNSTTTSAVTAGSINVSTSVGKWEFALFAVFMHSTAECTDVTWGSGVFTRLSRSVGTNMSVEIWVGTGFDVNQVDSTLAYTFSASVPRHRAAITTWRNPAIPTQPMTAATPVAGAGTGTTVSTSALQTPVGDESEVVFGAFGYASATQPAVSAYTSSPGGAETFYTYASAVSTATAGVWMRIPTSASPHGVTVTIPNVEWVATQVLVTPNGPVAVSPSHIYKGRDTKTLDEAGVA